MKRKIPTQRQIDERKRRKAMPIALIERPLRLIESKDFFIERDVKGAPKKVPGPIAVMARQAAAQGNGRLVNGFARSFVWP